MQVSEPAEVSAARGSSFTPSSGAFFGVSSKRLFPASYPNPIYLSDISDFFPGYICESLILSLIPLVLTSL